ncbi:MAG: monovalent cation/H(+) antiporter subunit G [Candidatus Eisenbacteria bacterium]
MSSNVIIGYILISIGAFFDFVGCVGLLRLPDVYNRCQAATKCVTLGTILVLAGTAVVTASPAIAIKAGLCAVFVLFTSPTAAHALVRGSYLAGVRLWDKSVVNKFKERAQEIKYPLGEDK